MKSSAEKRLAALMKLWALLFFGGGISFLSAPDRLIDSMNEVATGLGFAQVGAIAAPSSEEFWLALSVSMMFTIGTLAALVAAAPRRNVACAYAIVVAKVTSSAIGLAMYLFKAKALAYLVIAAVDFPIALVTVLFLLALGSDHGASLRNAASH